MHKTKFTHNEKINRTRELCEQFNREYSGTLKQSTIEKIVKKIGKGVYVSSPFFCDYGNITIGNNCYINAYFKCLDYGAITIGDNVGIGVDVTLVANNHPCNPMTLDVWEDIAEPIVIEDDVWIGANVTILGNVTIGKGAIIGACSVVTKDVPAGEVWAGTPARYIETVEEFKAKHKNK